MRARAPQASGLSVAFGALAAAPQTVVLVIYCAFVGCCVVSMAGYHMYLACRGITAEDEVRAGECVGACHRCAAPSTVRRAQFRNLRLPQGGVAACVRRLLSRAAPKCVPRERRCLV